MPWRYYLQKWLVRLKITTLKVHTSLLCKSGHCTGCTPTNLEWCLSVLPTAKKEIYYLPLYRMQWQWINILLWEAVAFWCPSKSAYDWKLSKTGSISVCQLTEMLKEKRLWIREMWSMVRSQQDGWVHSADLPRQGIGHGYDSILCSYWTLKLDSLSLVSASAFRLHLTNCRIVGSGSVWIIHTLLTINRLICLENPEEWQLVQSEDLNRLCDSVL